MPKRVVVLLASVVLTALVTAVMSLAFHRTIRLDFMITGLVCALIVSLLVERITRKYRKALRAAQEQRLAAARRALELEAAQRQLLETQLDAAERMATAGAIAAAVCHEVRNPLTAVVCNLEIAALRLEQGAVNAASNAVAGASEGATQVGVIISDLAALAMPIDRLEPVKLAEIVATARRLSAHELRHIADVAIDVDPDLVVDASRARLIQVFVNLLCNAAQATDPERPNRIAVFAGGDGAGVAVVVSDTGVGMSDETLARVFEPFFTTRADGGGTGLGISICRSIVESFGGRLRIESEPGVGTQAIVELEPPSDRASSRDGETTTRSTESGLANSC